METLRDCIQLLIKINNDLIDKKIDIETAKQISNNTQIIINGAKVFVDYAKLYGANVSFIDDIPKLKENCDEQISVSFIKGLLNITEPEANKFYHICKSNNLTLRSQVEEIKKLYNK